MKKNALLKTNERTIALAKGGIQLRALLDIPENPRGLVIFAHGSGSGRLSPRNHFVAQVLREAGVGTLLLDLLTESEELDRSNVFDIELLASRLVETKSWLSSQVEARGLAVGYFGASTGAGAALVAAAIQPDGVAAVVSRGGRPDLAGHFLEQVQAPTLLIVGGEDHVVIDLNREALGHLRCHKEIQVIPGATHLFEESGALEEVARLAADWFKIHLSVQPRDQSALSPRRPVDQSEFRSGDR
jgi:putative phosphoribosyl transferase